MNDEELKKIIEETIGNNDPFWNEPVYTVVKKIMDLPNEVEITIAKLLNYEPKEDFVDPLTQGKITNLIKEVCKKINIGLERTGNKFIGLAYNVQYKKVKLDLESNYVGDKELKKIVERIIGNNDPFWNETVYKVVRKICDLPEGEETTISNLLSDSNYTSKQLFDIHSCVNKVCRKLNIKLDFSGNQNKVGGLPYNLPFKKIKYELICPSCGGKLLFLMPDGNHLHCNACGKYYLNNDGNVGDETKSPYNKNDVLY